MSVEAVPSNSEAPAPPTVSETLATTPEGEIVSLPKEQNALLRELLATVRPPTPDPRIAKAKTIAATVLPTDEASYVAVNTTTGEHAVSRTIAAAADALNAPSAKVSCSE